MYRLIVKRIFDLIGAVLIGVPAFPIMLVVALFVRIDSPGSVIFRQERVGMNGRIFTIYKFRTMRMDTEKDGVTLTDAERMTRLGGLIRKLSLDELPQIWNILKGEMSFIGPRPLLVRYIPFYTEEENERHSVRPGISGLAQVNGRNVLGWDARLQMDVKYVSELSFFMDMQIFYKTIKKVFAATDVVVRDANAMLAFDEERKLRDHKCAAAE